MNYRDFASQEQARRIYGRAHKSIGVAVLLWAFCWPALLWWMFGAAWGIVPFAAVFYVILAVDAGFGLVASFVVGTAGLVAAISAITGARDEERRLLEAG